MKGDDSGIHIVNPGLINPRLFIWGGYHFNSQLLLFGGTTIIDQPGFINPGLTLCVYIYIYIMYIIQYIIRALRLYPDKVPRIQPANCRNSLRSVVNLGRWSPQAGAMPTPL